jgi:tetratricopeptide (TPR) repeat protein
MESKDRRTLTLTLTAIGLTAIGVLIARITLYYQREDREQEAQRQLYAALDLLGAAPKRSGELSIPLYEGRGGKRVDAAPDRVNLEKARRAIEEFERLSTDDGTAHFLRIVYSARLNDLPAVEDGLKRLAADANDPSLEAWMLLLVAKLDGNANRAQRLYQAAISKAPNDPLPQIIYGAHLHSMGDNDNALVHLRKALAINQNNPVTINSIAHVLSETGQASAAIDLASHAIRRGLRYAELHNTLGYAYWVHGDYRGAAREFRRASEIDVNDPIYFQNLSLALGKIGDETGSLAAMTEAKRLGLPENDDFYRSGTPIARI